MGCRSQPDSEAEPPGARAPCGASARDCAWPGTGSQPPPAAKRRCYRQSDHPSRQARRCSGCSPAPAACGPSGKLQWKPDPCDTFAGLSIYLCEEPTLSVVKNITTQQDYGYYSDYVAQYHAPCQSVVDSFRFHADNPTLVKLGTLNVTLNGYQVYVMFETNSNHIAGSSSVEMVLDGRYLINGISRSRG